VAAALCHFAVRERQPATRRLTCLRVLKLGSLGNTAAIPPIHHSLPLAQDDALGDARQPPTGGGHATDPARVTRSSPA
jgi:hypothetical protein